MTKLPSSTLSIGLFFLALIGFSYEPAWALDGFEPVAPEDVGISSARLERIDEWMQSYVDENKLAGIEVAIVRHGKLAYVGKVGVADIAKQRPITDQTIYRIFSMTKPITSVALMTLFEEGKFLLDDSVAKYLPAFRDVKVYAGEDKNGAAILEPPRRHMTIRDLMTHTSGLAYGLFRSHPVDKMYVADTVFDKRASLTTLTDKISKMPLADHPGDAWRYSLAVDVQARLVEVLSGQSFDVYLQERIFDSLDMKDTGFIVNEDDRERFAEVYQRDEQAGLRILEPPPGLDLIYSDKVKLYSGGSGLVSTTSDYLKFAQMLLAGGHYKDAHILGRKTVELMMMDHLPDELGPFPDQMEGYGFGLGGAVRRDVAQSMLPGSVGEFNWGGAASTLFWVDPEEDMVVVMMTQLIPSETYPLRPELRALVYQALIN